MTSYETRYEAAEILGGWRTASIPGYLEALQIAGEALVERKERRDLIDNLDRENWRCPMCDWNKKQAGKRRKVYCQSCGRPLTEAAWAEMKWRFVGDDE